MDNDSTGSSNQYVWSRRALFFKMQQQNLVSFEDKLEYIENELLSFENYTQEQIKDIKHRFSYIKSDFKRRWCKSHKKEDVFLKKNSDWLQGTFIIPKVMQVRELSGRPVKPFRESSERSKRRKTEKLRRETNEDVLLHAAQLKLRTSGKRDASQLLKEIAKSPKRATKYKQLHSLPIKGDESKLTPLKALSMFVEANLSKKQYEIIRSTMKKKYPSYSVLQRAKQDCYPPKESYHVTETCAETKLQDLLNHTVERLLTYLEEVIEDLSPKERSTLELISKWGCDGSQQAQFKQKMETNVSDANVFQSCFVPLKLVCGANSNKVIWVNPTPSSPRYCRPMRIRFVKESVDITNEEICYIESAIKVLQNTEFIQGDKTFLVKHTMMLTMVDAKVCNAATGTSSTMRCYICGATSRQLNDLSIKYDIDTEALSFGLSILHARIRFFESILHLSYKLPVQKWQLRSDDDKAIVKQRKAAIQEKFRLETGLIVDVPRAGFGNTNDGNTSRRFFSNPELAANITGVDFNYIYRLKVILEVISSGHKVDLNKFAEYGMQTARLYVEMYPWHPMTPTVHKILIHGATVMEHALLPVGLLSEEALEARNKHFRRYRQDFARKFSRELCNLDVLNRLLLSSDPLVTSLRPTRVKKTSTFSKEALEMLIPAEPNPSNEESDSMEEFTEDEEETSDEES